MAEVAVSHAEKNLILKCIRMIFPKAKILIFGSRARGDAHKYSDLDIALNDDSPLPASKLRQLEDLLTESSLTYKTDIVDYATLEPDFRAIVDRDGIHW